MPSLEDAQLDFAKDFLSSPTLFDCLFYEKPMEKNDEASAIFRDQGNKFYQQKQMQAI